MAFITANRLVARLETLGLLEETTGGKRFRRFRYTPYLALFADPVQEPYEARSLQATTTE